MKRCSECDFIYEDDQNLCDMDGHDLVCDPTLQSFQVNAATKPPTRPAKSHARRLVLAAAVAVLVGTVLSVGFSGLTSDYVPQTTKAPSTNVIRQPRSGPDQSPAEPNVIRAPQSVPDQSPAAPNVIRTPQSVPDQSPAAPVASPRPSPSDSPQIEKTRSRPATGSSVAKSTPRFPSVTPGRETVRSEPAKANHKKGSKIGGFLKKTGKILKRPFNF